MDNKDLSLGQEFSLIERSDYCIMRIMNGADDITILDFLTQCTEAGLYYH